MKAKILAVFAAGLLLTACQTADINEKTPQDEVQIENEETPAADSDNGEAEKEDDSEQDNQTQKGSSDKSSNELPNEVANENTDETTDKSPNDNTDGDPSTKNEGQGDTGSENTSEASAQNGSSVTGNEGQEGESSEVGEEKELIGYIPNEDIKTGVTEACQILYDIKQALNNESLEILEFENIYDKYWVQSAPLNTMASFRQYMQAYFTEEVTQDLIDMWGLIEYQGRLMAPEISKVSTYDPASLEPIVSEVDETAKQRFINLGFVDESGRNHRTLLVLKRSENGSWKINTIPGTGKIKQYGRAIIRNKVWVEGGVEWQWPDFMASEDQVWDKLLDPVQTEIREQTAAVLNTFEPEEAFKKIGASQLSYWTSWAYSEDNIDYPHMDIVLSEYMKYGIHPNHVKETVTLSKSTNKVLELSDLYTDKEKFYETVNVYIDKHMRENPDGFYADAVFEGINEASQFYISDKGITFYFQLYEYAPYAFGYPEIEVPFQTLEKTLAEPFLKYLPQEDQKIDEEEIENTDS